MPLSEKEYKQKLYELTKGFLEAHFSNPAAITIETTTLVKQSLGIAEYLLKEIYGTYQREEEE